MNTFRLSSWAVLGLACSLATVACRENIDGRVEKLLSQMTFLEKLAQMRNVGGILGANASYSEEDVFGFNDGHGGGSIC